MRPPAPAAPRPARPPFLPAPRHRHHTPAGMTPRAEHTAARAPQHPGPVGEPRPPRPGRRRRHLPPAARARQPRPGCRPARRRGLHRQHQHRHDHRGPVTAPRPQAGRKKDMRPPARTAPPPPRPELLQAIRHRDPPPARMPPRAEHPAARAPKPPGQQTRLDTLRRTPYRYHQVPPPAPSGGLPRSHCQEINGEGRCRLFMATVTSSISPRLANPPNHPDRHR